MRVGRIGTGIFLLELAAPSFGQGQDWQTREYQTSDGKKTCTVSIYRGVAPYDWDNIQKVIITGKPVTEVTEICKDKTTNPTLYTFAIDEKVHMFRYNDREGRGSLSIDVVEPDSELLKSPVSESGIRGYIPEGSEQAIEVNRRHKATRNAVRNHFVRNW